jgi:uncharacterized membrane protein
MSDAMWTMMSGVCGAGGLAAVLTGFSWVVLLSGLALVVGWALRRARPGAGNVALEILRERYARGEIGREEFAARRRDL